MSPTHISPRPLSSKLNQHPSYALFLISFFLTFELRQSAPLPSEEKAAPVDGQFLVFNSSKYFSLFKKNIQIYASNCRRQCAASSLDALGGAEARSTRSRPSAHISHPPSPANRTRAGPRTSSSACETSRSNISPWRRLRWWLATRRGWTR